MYQKKVGNTMFQKEVWILFSLPEALERAKGGLSLCEAVINYLMLK